MATRIKRPEREEFTITYKKGAYYKLKELAKTLEIPEENLGEVLKKGVKLIDFAKDGKITVEKYGTKFDVDLKKL